MYPIKRILVALDLTDMDVTLIQYAAFIAKNTPAEKIYFVNIIRNFHIPESVLKEFPGLMDTAIAERKEKMKAVVDAHFHAGEAILTRFKIQYLVKDGAPARKLLQMSQDSDIDLIIAGRKVSLEGSGVLVQRLARRAACNLLIVPEGSKPKIKTLLVPSDFSEHSKLALEATIQFAHRNPGIQIVVQNVYTVPPGYHYSGKTYQEFSAIMEKHARKDYKKFIREIDLMGQKIKDVYSLDENDNLMTDIYDKAIEINADGIVIGAKGRTAATALFLGSIAERAIQMNTRFPLLVIRPKGQNAGFLDFIMDI
ncbi:universal stress protein [Cesiribacter andamanensis]|uniref:Universal stress protein F n=1 Tax=Cesiribacter andamanensis AMV16 TaxID=1279009 RepID=M7MXH6_9BACT|nr:universal stress protein [Cesiribacter andamanensis]EMR01148.1 universal stress protein F [Cesiribacter andamanensis AMV16]